MKVVIILLSAIGFFVPKICYAYVAPEPTAQEEEQTCTVKGYEQNPFGTWDVTSVTCPGSKSNLATGRFKFYMAGASDGHDWHGSAFFVATYKNEEGKWVYSENSLFQMMGDYIQFEWGIYGFKVLAWDKKKDILTLQQVDPGYAYGRDFDICIDKQVNNGGYLEPAVVWPKLVLKRASPKPRCLK